MPGVQIELVMKSDEAKTYFRLLAAQRAELEKALGLPMHEHNDKKVKSAKFWVRREIDFLDHSKWPECFDWLGRYLLRFTEVFAPMIKKL